MGEIKNSYQKIIVHRHYHKGGIGFVGTLTIIFIVLRLLNLIDWSWWWVLSPIWISALLFIGFIVMLVIFAMIFIKKER